jgi:putative ABC transport system permease protein
MSLQWTFAQAARSLRRSPGFSAAAVAILATIIGANVATFSVVNAVLLRPLPYPHPEQLVAIRGNFPAMNLRGISVSAGEFLDYQQRTSTFSALTAFQTAQPTLIEANGSQSTAFSITATAGVFEVLGVSPRAGRFFTDADAVQGASPVAVIGGEFWRRHFGADPEIIGRTINLSGTTVRVIGVAPERLKFPPTLASVPPDVWMPLAFSPAALVNRGNRNFSVLGRLRDGTSLERANDEVRKVAATFSAEFPNNYPANSPIEPSTHSVTGELTASVKSTLLLFMGAVFSVLIVGCANLANLLLVRGTTRQTEVAVRMALGANSQRIIFQLLAESFLLSVAGTVAGLALSVAGVRALVAIGGTTLPWLSEATIDWRVLAFATTIGVVTALVFGLFPARAAASLSFHRTLRAGGKGAVTSVPQRRARSVLLASELALAMVLLSGAALLIRSFERVLRDSPGFNAEGVLTARVTAPVARFADSTSVRNFYRELHRVVGEIPGVTAAGLIHILPLSGNRNDWGFLVEGRVVGPGTPPADEQVRMVDAGFFSTIGTPVLEGRDFTGDDREGGALVVVVNEALAKKIWPGESALGKRVSFSGGPNAPQFRTVVGVVANVRHDGLDAPFEPHLYVPIAQTPFVPRGVNIVARIREASPAVRTSIQQAIAAVDPGQPQRSVGDVAALITNSVAPRRFSMLLITSFAVLSLVLAALGTFAVTAFAVSQRTREMGIRMALGARPGDAVRRIVADGARVAGIGIILGVILSIPAMRFIRSQLYGVTAYDPLSFVAVAGALGVVTIVACYLPARKMTRVSPTIALREE